MSTNVTTRAKFHPGRVVATPAALEAILDGADLLRQLAVIRQGRVIVADERRVPGASQHGEAGQRDENNDLPRMANDEAAE